MPAPAGLDAGTASQLIPGVRRTSRRQAMRDGPIAAAVALLLASCPSLDGAPPRWTDAAVVEYAKNLPARSIESSLPATPLDSWLRETLGVFKLEWFISDCDLRRTGHEPAKDWPLCVGARVPKSHPIAIRFHLVVGNLRDGISGKPYVFNTSFLSCNPPTVDRLDVMEGFENLGALEAGLLRTTKVCTKGKR
jgi:hypothetical protein